MKNKQYQHLVYIQININHIYIVLNQMGNDSSDEEVYNPPVYVQVGPTDAQIKEAARLAQVQNDRLAAQARALQLQIQQRQRQQQAQRRQAERRQQQRILQQQQQQQLQRENYALAVKKQFQQYLAQLKAMSITSSIPRSQAGQKHYAVVGPIGSGKTTLLNFIFNTNQQEGLGETTLEAKPVFKCESKKLIVWDVPGINKDFSIYAPSTLSFFSGCNRIFVIYKDSPKRCENVIKVLNTIKPNTLYLIRTQCDNWDAEQSKTLEEERKTDQEILASWDIKIVEFYQHSSKAQGFNNEEVRKKMSE